MMPDQTRINVRAVIQKDNRVLLCHFVKDHDYLFFPGGGVEFGEGAEAALGRELQEELGVNVTNVKFIGAGENVFPQDGKPYHELNIVFSATLDDATAESKEGHISFTWMPIAKLESENVLPKQLVLAVLRWMKDGRTFWVNLDPQEG